MAKILNNLSNRARRFAADNLKTDEIDSLNKTIWSKFGSVFRKPRQGRKETFAQAMARMNLNEEDIENCMISLGRERQINFALLGASFLYLCSATFAEHPLMHFCLSLSILLYIVVRLVAVDFKAFRTRHRALISFDVYVKHRWASLRGEPLPALEEVEQSPPDENREVIGEVLFRNEDVARSLDEFNAALRLTRPEAAFAVLRATFIALYHVDEVGGEDKDRALFDNALVFVRSVLPAIFEARDILYRKKDFAASDFLVLLKPSSLLSLMRGINMANGEDMMISLESRYGILGFMGSFPGFDERAGGAQTSETFYSVYEMTLSYWVDLVDFLVKEAQGGQENRE